MQPKERAKRILKWFTGKYGSAEAEILAQFMVDEVISSLPKNRFHPGFIGEAPNEDYEYWQKVKLELSKI
jgi:hypothetical protein